MTMRKITTLTHSGSCLYAACVDGSLWELERGGALWSRMPDIPEDEAPPKKRGPRAGCTILQFLADCKDTGEQAIPQDHPVMVYAREAGIPDEFLRLHWIEFKERHTENKKTYKDWRAAFSNSVRGNWFKIWFIDGEGCKLSTVGQQVRNRLEAKQ